MSTLYPLVPREAVPAGMRDGSAGEHARFTWTLTSDGGIGDVVTDLYEQTAAPAIVVFASTQPGFEGFRVLTMTEALEAAEHMGPGVRESVQQAPKMPKVRIFLRYANGDVTFSDMTPLRLNVDMSKAPS